MRRRLFSLFRHPWWSLSPSAVKAVILTFVFLWGCRFLLDVAFSRLTEEVTQRAHFYAASAFADRLKPILLASGYSKELREEVVKIEEENPAIDLYLIDNIGVVRASRPGSGVKDGFDSVVMHRIVRLIRKGLHAVPLPVSDPKDPSVRKPASVGTIDAGGARWYVVALYQNRPKGIVGLPYRGIKGSMEVIVPLYTLFGYLGLAFVLQGVGSLVLRIMYPRPEDEVIKLAQSVSAMSKVLALKVEALQSGDEEKQTFVAGLSHDLKSPLASLKGYTEKLIAKGDKLSESEYEEHLLLLSRNARHVSSVVEKILELPSFESLQSTMKVARCDLVKVVQEAVISHRAIAERRKISLEVAHPEGRAVLLGDSELLQRAISNLLENALKFARTRVSLVLDVHPVEVIVSIRDDGNGIADQDLPHLFERFYRGVNNREQKNGSSGLGLFIVKQIADAHKGRIEVVSELERGTKFSLVLPRN